MINIRENSLTLDQWATIAFETFRDESPEDRAEAVAITVGKQAARAGIDKKELLSWLQSAYGNIWVKLGNLNPGLDLKDIIKIVLKAYE